MKMRPALAWFLLGSVLVLIRPTAFLKTSASSTGSKAPMLTRLGDRVTVHAEGRGAPTINIADGREMLTAYDGEPEAQRLLQQNLAQPLTMAAADFDEDGVPDLLTGYAAPNGGILTLHQGNIDSIHPNTPEAQQRKADGEFTNAPFLSPARAFETPRPVDFIGCGDFDADGHADVVTAARGTSALYFFAGNGRGEFGAPRAVELPGAVTSLAIGEINRADGLADIVVAVSGADGPEALVFEASDGALRAAPEAFRLQAEASALGLGRLDDDCLIDLAIASGRELIVVRGQARGPHLNKPRRSNRQEPVIDRRSFPFAIKSLVIGDFNGNQRDDVALLSSDGAVHVLSGGDKASVRSAKKESSRLRKWRDKTLPGAWPQARLLNRARVSSLPADDLVVVDSANRRLEILADNRYASHNIQAPAPGAPEHLQDFLGLEQLFGLVTSVRFARQSDTPQRKVNPGGQAHGCHHYPQLAGFGQGLDYSRPRAVA